MIPERAAIHALMTLGLLQSLSYTVPAKPDRWRTIEADLGPLRLEAHGHLGSLCYDGQATESRGFCALTAQREASDFRLAAGDIRLVVRMGDRGEFTFHGRSVEPE